MSSGDVVGYVIDQIQEHNAIKNRVNIAQNLVNVCRKRWDYRNDCRAKEYYERIDLEN